MQTNKEIKAAFEKIKNLPIFEINLKEYRKENNLQ